MKSSFLRAQQFWNTLSIIVFIVIMLGYAVYNHYDSKKLLLSMEENSTSSQHLRDADRHYHAVKELNKSLTRRVNTLEKKIEKLQSDLNSIAEMLENLPSSANNDVSGDYDFMPCCGGEFEEVDSEQMASTLDGASYAEMFDSYIEQLPREQYEAIRSELDANEAFLKTLDDEGLAKLDELTEMILNQAKATMAGLLPTLPESQREQALRRMNSQQGQEVLQYSAAFQATAQMRMSQSTQSFLEEVAQQNREERESLRIEIKNQHAENEALLRAVEKSVGIVP